MLSELDESKLQTNLMRGKQRRIISARRAHRNERQDYANHLKSAGEGRD